MPSPASDAALDTARRLLDEGEPTLQALADVVGLSPGSLQRRFRARFGLTPAAYLAQRKLGRLRQALRAGDDVTTAIHAAGYGSPSRVYEAGAARLGMAPGSYRRGGAGEAIAWATLDTCLGRALVASTLRGICMVELGHDDAALLVRLRREFPAATLHHAGDGRDEFLAPRLHGVADALAGLPVRVDLDLLGTAFQRRVWSALMRIPAGETRSYAQVADGLGMPRAARAVAKACAGNRVAIIVPCHRVVRGDGGAGGYRWGLPLKQALLAREDARSAPVAGGPTC